MIRYGVLLTAILCLVAPGVSQAQETAPEPLPLARAIDDTLERSASLRAARAGVDAARAEANVAASAQFPRISFAESWQRGNQPVFVFSTLLASRRFAATNFALDQLNHPDPLGSFHTTVAFDHLVFDGGRRSAGIDTARAQREMADVTVSEAQLGLVTTVTELYGRLLSVQAARSAAAAALEAGREDLARAERRRDAGVLTEADVLALRVHVADMEQRAIQADGDAAVVRAQLNRLMGAPVDRRFTAVEPEPSPASGESAIGQLLAEAEAQRPEMRRSALAQRIADDARRSATSTLVPQVAAQAAFDVTGTRVADRASSWLVGGEVRWSLSTGGAERAQMKAAAANAARARAEADDTRAQIHVDVVTALELVRSARAREAVGRAAVAQARESQRIIRDRYDAGLLPINDVLRAAGALLDANTQRVAALVDEMTGQARLNRALGRLR